ncbi:hypothetical protein ACJMK2_016028 [Sinanodonta woodiana]|uniref:LAGLIDADG homing endonuclease n=1 Tax=Sinanodonta woodiana TaxID=1069815 RepID=A0ABD3UTH1_SINWO
MNKSSSRVVIIRNWIVVGNRHHYGNPLNPYYQVAVAVFDGLQNIGNLKFDSTKCICKILQGNSHTTKILIKPKYDAEVVSKKNGPQQMCVAAFRGRP